MLKFYQESFNKTKFDYRNRPYVYSLVVLTPIGYITNVLILYVVIKIFLKDFAGLKSYLFLANICVANIFAITANMAVTLLSTDGCKNNPTIDLIEKGIVVTPVLVSMWCVCLVTVERLIYITCPLKYDNNITTTRVVLMIAGVWLLSTVAGFIPAKLFFERFVDKGSDSIPIMLIVQFSVATFLIIVMFSVIISLYRFSVNLVNNSRGLTMKTVILRTLIFLLFTLLLFVLSWEPYLITSTVYYFRCSSHANPDYPCNELWSAIVYPLPWITILNSCINPNSYIWWYKPFLESFKLVFFPASVRQNKRIKAISNVSCNLKSLNDRTAK